MVTLHKPWAALQDNWARFSYKEIKFALPCIQADRESAVRVSTSRLMHCYLLHCSKLPKGFKLRSKGDQIPPLQFRQQHLFARSVLSTWSQNQYYGSLLKREEPQFLCLANPHGYKQESSCVRVKMERVNQVFSQQHTPSPRELTTFWKTTWKKRLQTEQFCSKCS